MKAILTEIRSTDYESLFEWINDRGLVVKNNNYKPIHDLNHKEWFKSILTSGNYYFAIRLQGDNKIIGTCSLRNINAIARCAELQIRIGTMEFRGKGLGTMAVNQLMQFGFADLNLNRIYLDVYEDNEIAIKVYEKCGFIKEGIFREADFIDGYYKNIVRMAIIKKDI